MTIEVVGEEQLPELLPLMRAYNDFYETDPSDEALLELSRTLISDPQLEGVQLLARSGDGTPVGFATVYWLWSTTRASRVALMNDLYVDPGARRTGVGEALIDRCVDVARERGATVLEWQTAPDNTTAQSLYDRVGVREGWISYRIDVD